MAQLAVGGATGTGEALVVRAPVREQPATENGMFAKIRRLLPTGDPLPDEVWESRHRVMLILAWFHVLAIPITMTLRHYQAGFFSDFDPVNQGVGRGLAWAGIVALFAIFGSWKKLSHRSRAVFASLALLTSSAALVNIFNGSIEFHFHYFVVVALVALYQDWVPFLVAIGYVALQHGVFGVIDPAAVYNHHGAQHDPWLWAGVHAAFILAESAAVLTGWRLSEQEAARRRQAQSEAAHLAGRTAALEDANRVLAEANRLKGEFLSTMSHELRAPMDSILGYGHLLLDGGTGDLTPEQAADVAQITESAEHLLRLIDNVLDLSKIEAGRMDVHPEEIDLAKLVGQVRSHFVLAAQDKNLAIVVDIPSDLPPIVVDPDHLRQILTNLIGNAVKFTDRGRVAISARVTGQELRLAVSDTGVGIPQSALAFIFEAFRQADSSLTRRFGGSGLGLSIARRLAELQGGTIEVSSQVGVGSTFTLTLPLAAPQPAAEPPVRQLVAIGPPLRLDRPTAPNGASASPSGASPSLIGVRRLPTADAWDIEAGSDLRLVAAGDRSSSPNGAEPR
jgi:signal transduction histidine kinase